MSKNWHIRNGSVVDERGEKVVLNSFALSCGRSSGEADRNTSDIIRAVNYHDRLVDALQDMLNADADGQIKTFVESAGKAELLLTELSAYNGGEG